MTPIKDFFLLVKCNEQRSASKVIKYISWGITLHIFIFLIYIMNVKNI